MITGQKRTTNLVISGELHFLLLLVFGEHAQRKILDRIVHGFTVARKSDERVLESELYQ